MSKYDGKTFTNFTEKEGLSNNTVASLIEDHLGNLWFGTVGGGVSKYDGKTFTRFTGKEGLSDNTVWSILEDHLGNLWFGTSSGGVSKYDGKTFTYFTETEGLLSNNVGCILEDHLGNLWFGSSFGLSKLTAEKSKALSEKIRTGTLKDDDVFFKNYTYEDGFLGIGCSALHEDSKGTIWIGTTDRVTALHPSGENEFADTIAPNIQITGVQLFNENIPWSSLLQKKDSSFVLKNGVKISSVNFKSTSRWYGLPGQLSLAYNNNYLNFSFVGITMNQPQKVKYKYKMEGLDNNWSAISTRNEANYGNVPPGSYTFKVKAMNSSGYWSKEFQYDFTIRPPWYKTWLAYIIYALLFAGALRAYIIFRSRNLTRQNKKLEDTVTTRTQELKKSLDNLKSTQSQLIQSEKMASLGELTAGIAHEIQNPLNFVNNFSEVNKELVDELQQELKAGKIDDAIAISNDIKDNEEKINHHGKRADAIVKGMLQHSRTSTGKKNQQILMLWQMNIYG